MTVPIGLLRLPLDDEKNTTLFRLRRISVAAGTDDTLMTKIPCVLDTSSLLGMTLRLTPSKSNKWNKTFSLMQNKGKTVQNLYFISVA